MGAAHLWEFCNPAHRVGSLSKIGFCAGACEKRAPIKGLCDGDIADERGQSGFNGTRYRGH